MEPRPARGQAPASSAPAGRSRPDVDVHIGRQVWETQVVSWRTLGHESRLLDADVGDRRLRRRDGPRRSAPVASRTQREPRPALPPGMRPSSRRVRHPGSETETLVRLIGIDRAGPFTSDTGTRTRTRSRGELLVGTDERHLDFEMSFQRLPDRVVLITAVLAKPARAVSTRRSSDELPRRGPRSAARPRLTAMWNSRPAGRA
jgi:hypothetical protein